MNLLVRYILFGVAGLLFIVGLDIALWGYLAGPNYKHSSITLNENYKNFQNVFTPSSDKIVAQEDISQKNSVELEKPAISPDPMPIVGFPEDEFNFNWYVSAYYDRNNAWKELEGKFIDIANGSSIPSIEIRTMSNGHILVREGPELVNYMSNSECGACTRINFQIYEIDTERKLYKTLIFYQDNDPGYDTGLQTKDVKVSDDWTSVKIYSAHTEDYKTYKWYFAEYCSKDSYPLAYKWCNHASDVQRPIPFNFNYDSHQEISGGPILP